MKTALVTFVRQWKTLHYPLEIMLDCAKACDERIVVVDPSDPDLAATVDGLKAMDKRITIGELSIPWGKMAEKGNDLMRRLLEVGIASAVHALGCTHILHLEADEVMDAEDVKSLLNEAPVVAWVPSWQLWGDVDTIRLDWSFTYPRFAALEALLPRFNRGAGEASCLPVKPDYAVAQFPQWPIWHLSRIGDPRMIARRRFAVAEMYVGAEQLDVPKKYDFVPRRYENWVRGQMPPEVPGNFMTGHNDMPLDLEMKIREWSRADWEA